MAKAAKGLGKGLEALLGDLSPAVGHAVPTNAEFILPLRKIDPNREQPRKDFDEDKLKELAASIAQSGIIQPLIVMPYGERYRIVAGERRWRAARLAGLHEVPVIVREYDATQLMELALVENLQRENLNPVEEAAGIALLMQQHDLTQEEVAERLGKSRPAVANSVRLLTLPDGVLEHVRGGALSAGHARTLVALENPSLQVTLAGEIADKGLTVRQAEELVNGFLQQKKKPPKEPRAPRMRDAVLADLENTMQQKLETKVKVVGSLARGHIVVEYYTQDQLDQLYQFITK